MTATRKLTEAEDIFLKLNNSPDEEFDSVLRKFITSIHETFLHLLDEYNLKFDCKLERISLDRFKSAAKKQGNLKAIKFLIWYEREYRKIKDNVEFGALLDKDYTPNQKEQVTSLCSKLLSETKFMVYSAYENF